MVEEYRAKGAPPPQPAAQTRQPAGPPKHKWVFHGPPVTAPGGHVPFQVPEEWAEDLARHLETLAFYTRDELILLAGEDGVLRPADLPGPSMRQDPPLAGPRTWLNPGHWVPVSAPPPAAAVVEPPDLSTMSDEAAEAVRIENEAIAEGLRNREVWRARLREADPNRRGQEQ